MDAPVYQVKLTWNRFWLGNSGGLDSEFPLCPLKSSTFMVFAMTKAVDYLLIAKPVASNHLGIHHGCASSSGMKSAVGSSL
jgi:hypothetical protein